jgi:benzoate/toluate 1,2-dioxygenase reductase subunit
MSFNIALQFEDGVSRIIPCESGELVADAAYRAKINIPLDCRDGACGTCKCHCESGSYTMGEYIDDALAEDEAAGGFVLTCQMKPTSDCVVRVPASSRCRRKARSPSCPASTST